MSLRIVLPKYGQEFKVYSNDVDVTSKLDVYSIFIDVTPESALTKVKMEFYIDDVDLHEA